MCVCVLLYLSMWVLWSVPSWCFLGWRLITCECSLTVGLSKEWVTGPRRERKTVLLSLKTTQPFFGLCVRVQYTPVCASEARAVMSACVFNGLLCVCVEVDVLQPKVFWRSTGPLTFKLIAVPCVFTCAHVARFVFYISGQLTQNFCRELQVFPAQENWGQNSAVLFHSHCASF